MIKLVLIIFPLFFQPYKIYNPDYLGRAIIINNVASEFPGSIKDTAELEKMYENMNFQVHSYRDCNDVVGTEF